MAENKEDFHIYTKRELLVNYRNKVLDQIVEAEVQCDYMPLVLARKKAKDPEKEAMPKSMEKLIESLRRLRIRLGVIDTHIEIELKAEKKAKEKNKN